jgi:hypothetical protein
MLEALKIDHFTLEDKFMLLEELWESMKKDIKANDFTPQWHIDTLDKRQKKLESGELSFSDISTVKERLKNSI